MSAMASQITSFTFVYSTVYSGADQRKNQSSASLAFVGGIHRWLVNSPHKGKVMRKMFPFDDGIMDKAMLSLFVNCSTLVHRFKTSSLLYSFTSLKTGDAYMRGPGQHLSGRDLIGTNSSPRLCWLTWIVFSNLKNKFQWCLKNIPFNETRLVILSVHFVQHSVFQNIPMRSYGHWILRSYPLACVCVCLWNQKIASIREMFFVSISLTFLLLSIVV